MSYSNKNEEEKYITLKNGETYLLLPSNAAESLDKAIALLIYYGEQGKKVAFSISESIVLTSDMSEQEMREKLNGIAREHISNVAPEK